MLYKCQTGRGGRKVPKKCHVLIAWPYLTNSLIRFVISGKKQHFPSTRFKYDFSEEKTFDAPLRRDITTTTTTTLTTTCRQKIDKKRSTDRISFDDNRQFHLMTSSQHNLSPVVFCFLEIKDFQRKKVISDSSFL